MNTAPKYYYDSNSNIITVREGSIQGTYAFWRIIQDDITGRGNRVKTRPMRFFKNVPEAFVALQSYAFDRGWPQAPDNALELARKAQQKNDTSSKTKRGSVWNPQKHCRRVGLFNEKHCERIEFLNEVQSLDVNLYNSFRDHLVEAAVKILAEKTRYHVLRAIQIAQSTLLGQGKYIGRQYELLNAKIANDTGDRVNGLYVWENALGGVVGRVEAILNHN